MLEVAACTSRTKGDNYLYDGRYRLVTFEELVPAESVGAPGLPGASVVKDWKIDGVQNWRELITNSATTTTSVDAVNHYTPFGAAAPEHDINGNLLTHDVGSAPAAALEYDFLTACAASPAPAAARSSTTTTPRAGACARATGVASMHAVFEFVFDRWEEVEEHVKAASGSPFSLARRYVHGRSLDEPVTPREPRLLSRRGHVLVPAVDTGRFLPFHAPRHEAGVATPSAGSLPRQKRSCTLAA